MKGKALDVAGGAGRNAIWLARRGLDVTLVDISDVALEKADRRAAGLGIAKRLRTRHVDLDAELPFAPLFDVVLVFNYMNRARRDAFAALLVEGGMLIALQPTLLNLEPALIPSRPHVVSPAELERWARGHGVEIVRRPGSVDTHEEAVSALPPTPSNLQHHPTPSRPHLVEPGELERWARGLDLEIIVTRQGWVGTRHVEAVIARRTPALVPDEVDPADSGPSEGPYR